MLDVTHPTAEHKQDIVPAWHKSLAESHAFGLNLDYRFEPRILRGATLLCFLDPERCDPRSLLGPGRSTSAAPGPEGWRPHRCSLGLLRRCDLPAAPHSLRKVRPIPLLPAPEGGADLLSLLPLLPAPEEVRTSRVLSASSSPEEVGPPAAPLLPVGGPHPPLRPATDAAVASIARLRRGAMPRESRAEPNWIRWVGPGSLAGGFAVLRTRHGNQTVRTSSSTPPSTPTHNHHCTSIAGRRIFPMASQPVPPRRKAFLRSSETDLSQPAASLVPWSQPRASAAPRT
ncbi:unnamed protein product [Pleuronectes platessa]|uniref:Uncharacterized protein n=1 Tax=Pleuronectes platessa TaxID=8262 RepID=A0A9N7YFN2_PLEPL|nr:unnamed protein product [Pleuronectes platessa]